jgi:hypothetical protein
MPHIEVPIRQATTASAGDAPRLHEQQYVSWWQSARTHPGVSSRMILSLASCGTESGFQKTYDLLADCA